MKTTIRVGPSMRLVVAGLAAAVVVTAACGGNGEEEGQPPTPQPPTPAASGDYPKGSPKHLAEPFQGKPVPAAWFGRWHFEDFEAVDDVDTHILPANSPECRSITRGRTTCWTVGPRGSSTKTDDVYAAGAITVDGPMVVWRMTYNPDPSSPQCFEDDAYRYRYTGRRIYILIDNRKHCHYERSEAEAIPLYRKLDVFVILIRVE